MQLAFERGDPSAPRGHALLYFRDAREGARLYATYIVVLPVALDLVKYMPPFLAPHLPQAGQRELSAFAFPPVPEGIEGYATLQRLAQVREDDLLYGGEVDISRVPDLLARVNEIVEAYAQAYSQALQRKAPAPASPPEAPTEVGVTQVLYEFMTEEERLTELSRLVGKLRFALENGDEGLQRETEEEMALLVRYMPAHYRLEGLLEAVRDPSPRGAEIAHLYLERCYRLARRDDPGAQEVEERLRSLGAWP